MTNSPLLGRTKPVLDMAKEQIEEQTLDGKVFKSLEQKLEKQGHPSSTDIF